LNNKTVTDQGNISIKRRTGKLDKFKQLNGRIDFNTKCHIYNTYLNIEYGVLGRVIAQKH
jgi:hypothetical protein